MKVRIKNPDKPSMAKAIRAKCMNCAGEQEAEVRKCAIVACPCFLIALGAILSHTLVGTRITLKLSPRPIGIRFTVL